MADHLDFVTLEGEQALAAIDEVRRLCHVLFPDFTDSYLSDRLSTITGLALLAARGPDGALLGFKLGYPRCEETFYSWLGGIHPSMRRRGIGRELMQRQHAWARERGYRHVETRTRTSNNPMIILNLQSGFHIVAFETDAHGRDIVIQRVDLPTPDEDQGLGIEVLGHGEADARPL